MSEENLKLDNASLRKQILGYQKDLAMCRKVCYYTISQSRLGLEEAPRQHFLNIGRVSQRCLEEMEQR